MMKHKLLYGIGLLATFLTTGCETLEETYDEWSGDGMIRYVGKADSVTVNSGWKRLRVTWKNNTDANIKKTKVTWQTDNGAGLQTKYIERKKGVSTDTLWLEGLEDALYTVCVSNVAEDGTESFVKEIYGRPYTEKHEDLRIFGSGILNFYPLEDKLVVTLDESNEFLQELQLHYTGTDNKEYVWNILEHMTDSIAHPYTGGNSLRNSMFLLPEERGLGIDFNQPLTVTRKGRLAECLDTIPFGDVVLDITRPNWSIAFSLWMNQLYGPDWKEETDKITEIDLDYDLPTFEDLLYLPKLEKVNLGKNRFLYEAEEYWGTFYYNTSVTDQYKGLMTLQFLKTVRDVETVVYNKHYFFADMFDENYGLSYQDVLGTERGLLIEKGLDDQIQPQINPLDTVGWVLTCSDTTLSGYKSGGVACLLDDDSEVCFSPGLRSSITTYEVIYDMLEEKELKGFKLVQAHPDAIIENRKEVPAYLVSTVKIEVSADGETWEDATYVEGYITVGNNAGETTYLKVKENLKPVRYVRLSLASKQVGILDESTATFGLRLGDFIPY